MNRRNLGRLERLETPSRTGYVLARNRTLAWTLRSFGADLEEHEEADLEGYGEADFASDCGLMRRYRASLDPERRKREQHVLMKSLHRELERRGVDPYPGGEE